MKILVLGGTGAMGIHLVKLLERDGKLVFVTSRKQRNSQGLINYINGDSHDFDFLGKVLSEKWDAIIDFMVYSTEEFKKRINLFLTSTLQYIFLSSARVYADSDQAIKEGSPRLLDVSHDEEFLATDEYSLAKARQEDLLIQSDKKNWTVIRPYITYSESRLQLGVLEKEEWLYRALKGRTIVFSSDMLAKKTTLTYGLDVASGIANIIGKANSLGEIFHITNQDSYTWLEVLDIYLNILDNKLGYVPKVSIVDMEKFYPCHPAKYQINYDRLYNRQFDNSKIREFIPASKFTPTATGLTHCMDAFMNEPDFKNIKWRTEAIKDKLTGERTSLTEIQGFENKLKYLFFRFIAYNKKV